ncbi:hypothetical protein LCGC14_2500840 [marine sediment metagenome]|uniref:Uncharacterized protein n=1 Tax=marine sediment metagenome TaxID=412755 RepID=A0A0F9B2N5_9ZZZZ
MAATTEQMVSFCLSHLADAIKWHRANSNPSDQRIRDFGEGFKQGWREALATAKLHNYPTGEEE